MRGLLVLFLFFLLTSCAHQRGFISQTDQVGREDIVLSQGLFTKSGEQSHRKIPYEVNVHVKKWLKYFQGRGRPHMGRYLSRMGRYQLVMEDILEKQGVPRDLIYIAMIESGFSSHAKSHASAVGYWQFIRGTGKHYGLRIDHLVDERRDPILATVAAAKYFKGLYHVFGSWHLAMASYNAGENRVKRVVMQNYTRDFWELVKKKKLPRETLNYIPKFLAAREIGKNPRKYGFSDISRKDPLRFSTIRLKHSVDLKTLARQMGVSYRSLRSLNPQFRTSLAPTYKGKLFLRVGKGKGGLALRVAAKSRPSRYRVAQGSLSKGSYVVRKGDHLTKISKKFGVTLSQLRKWNGLSRRSFIRVGQRLKVSSSTLAVASNQTTQRRHVASYHKVIRGESFYRIARKYGVSISHLRRTNGLSQRYVLKAGDRLKVSKTTVKSSLRQPSNQKGDSYVVRKGDTLFGIALKHGVSLDKLAKANRIARRENIRVGYRLWIP